MVSRPEINIHGAPIGTFLCYLTVMALNLKDIKKVAGIKYEISDFVFKPGLSALLMGATAFLSYDFISKILVNNAGEVGTIANILALGATMAIAGVVYLIMIAIIGGLKKEDILLMPKGKKISEFM